jgi:hypothetical protein
VLKPFNQKEFFKLNGKAKHGMIDEGYIYYPYKCLDEGMHCNLHISLSGCLGGFIEWPRDLNGFINYAASNNLIVLYPMIKECYDNFGYSGPDWNNRNGAQPATFMNMI